MSNTAPKYKPITFPKGTTEQEMIDILNAQPDREFKVKSVDVERGAVNELDLPPISNINPLYAENIYAAVAKQAADDLTAEYVAKLQNKEVNTAIVHECKTYFKDTLKGHYARIIKHCINEACEKVAWEATCKKCKKRKRCQTKCEQFSNTLLEYITKATSEGFDKDG